MRITCRDDSGVRCYGDDCLQPQQVSNYWDVTAGRKLTTFVYSDRARPSGKLNQTAFDKALNRQQTSRS